MRFTVVWNRIAEEKLAALWTVARNQQAVTTSANHIDRLLRDSGEEVGVFFFEGQYLLARASACGALHAQPRRSDDPRVRRTHLQRRIAVSQSILKLGIPTGRLQEATGELSAEGRRVFDPAEVYNKH